jgi:hypothetical protein
VIILDFDQSNKDITNIKACLTICNTFYYNFCEPRVQFVFKVGISIVRGTINECKKRFSKSSLGVVKTMTTVPDDRDKNYRDYRRGQEKYLPNDATSVQRRSTSKSTIKRCDICKSTTTSLEKTKWGYYPHWYKSSIYGFERPICKNCYVRNQWQKKHVPKDAKCSRCGRSTLTVSRYGTKIWVRDKKRKNVYYCKGCFVIIRDTGQNRPQEARRNIGIGIHKALDKGIIFGKTKYSLDKSVFDTITEESAYWMGILMSDGNISSGKTGNPRIALTLAKVDYLHLVKFSKFLKCTNPILPKKKKYHGIIVLQYTLRFTSKHIAETLVAHGVVPRKSLIARAIGLENNRHFWRGVFDGDGYFKNKDGKDADKMILTGSNGLCAQFEEYIKMNVPDAKVRIKKIREYSKLYISSDTARAVAKLLYSDCKIALQRKYVKARRMIQWWR